MGKKVIIDSSKRDYSSVDPGRPRIALSTSIIATLLFIGVTFSGRSQLPATLSSEKAAETATKRGLDWFKSVAGRSRSGAEFAGPDAVGVFLLAFLGHGEIPASPEYGETVRRAISWVVTQGQIYDGRLSMRKSELGGFSAVSHAMTTSALIEYYRLSHDETVIPLINKAIGYILAGKGRDGGWGLSFSRQGDSDLWTTGWMMDALYRAECSGLGTGATNDALKGGGEYAFTLHGVNGFGLQRNDATVESPWTGVGFYVEAMRQNREGRIKHAELLQLFRHFPQGYASEPIDFELAYFDSMACYLHKKDGGVILDQWRQRLLTGLIQAQSPDGSWPVAQNGGSVLPVIGRSYDLQKLDNTAGRAYRTALCILMLETTFPNSISIHN
jgi:hypothetical protein